MHGAPLTSPATVTERQYSKSKDALGDDVASLVRRQLLDDTSDSHRANSDSGSDPGSVSEEEEEEVVQSPEYGLYIWFKNRHGEALLTAPRLIGSAEEAKVYPDSLSQIRKTIQEARSRLLPEGPLRMTTYYLEQFQRDNLHFYFAFFHIPYDHHSRFETIGGRPVRRPLLTSVPKSQYENHVWFTKEGYRIGPYSEARFFSAHTGLSYENAKYVLDHISRSDLVWLTSDSITVFREKWKPEYRQFHWQRYKRDQHGYMEPLFTESQLSVNLLPTPASPHNGVHGHGDA
ncbi:hypothetical protein EV361DRAFT_956113 [Lentinula raphanica]|nr:hypothetical protein EV361DRAFT_956113 [Lentinula raphanica]